MTPYIYLFVFSCHLLAYRMAILCTSGVFILSWLTSLILGQQVIIKDMWPASYAPGPERPTSPTVMDLAAGRFARVINGVALPRLLTSGCDSSVSSCQDGSYDDSNNGDLQHNVFQIFNGNSDHVRSMPNINCMGNQTIRFLDILFFQQDPDTYCEAVTPIKQRPEVFLKLHKDNTTEASQDALSNSHDMSAYLMGTRTHFILADHSFPFCPRCKAIFRRHPAIDMKTDNYHRVHVLSNSRYSIYNSSCHRVHYTNFEEGETPLGFVIDKCRLNLILVIFLGNYMKVYSLENLAYVGRLAFTGPDPTLPYTALISGIPASSPDVINLILIQQPSVFSVELGPFTIKKTTKGHDISEFTVLLDKSINLPRQHDALRLNYASATSAIVLADPKNDLNLIIISSSDHTFSVYIMTAAGISTPFTFPFSESCNIYVSFLRSLCQACLPFIY